MNGYISRISECVLVLRGRNHAPRLTRQRQWRASSSQIHRETRRLLQQQSLKAQAQGIFASAVYACDRGRAGSSIAKLHRRSTVTDCSNLVAFAREADGHLAVFGPLNEGESWTVNTGSRRIRHWIALYSPLDALFDGSCVGQFYHTLQCRLSGSGGVSIGPDACRTDTAAAQSAGHARLKRTKDSRTLHQCPKPLRANALALHNFEPASITLPNGPHGFHFSSGRT